MECSNIVNEMFLGVPEELMRKLKRDHFNQVLGILGVLVY